MKATGSFTPTKWDEITLDQISDSKKITKASVVLSFGGDGEISGRATVEWLMFYKYADEKDQHNSSATFVGLIRFNGKLNDKSGSFVMEDRGTFDAGALNAVLVILPGSGTAELDGITGSAKYNTSPTGITFEIEYNLAA
jgi:uncharacterized protein DUF3224